MLKKYSYFLLSLLACCSLNAAKISDHNVKLEKFPVIAYSAEPLTDENFELIKDIGFNMVHSYKTGRDDETNIKRGLKLLDLAQKHGMKVMFNLRGKDWAGKNFDLKNFTKFVRKFKSHPALGMWYLYDEPKIKALPNLQKLYGILKQETPNVPVAIAMCWSIDWNKFGEAYDILMPDIYPVGDQDFPNAPLEQFTDFTQQSVDLGKPVIPVAQMLNWRVFPKMAKQRKFDLKKCRYPNTEELRYWMFASAVMGTKGIAWYSYYWSMTHDGAKKWAKNNFKPALNEYKSFIKATNSLKDCQQLKRSRDARMLAMLCKDANKEYLVFVNNWPLERKNVSRWLENTIMEADLVPWGNTSKAKAIVQKGKLVLEAPMAPWEVFIWEVKRKTGEIK